MFFTVGPETVLVLLPVLVLLGAWALAIVLAARRVVARSSAWNIALVVMVALGGPFLALPYLLGYVVGWVAFNEHAGSAARILSRVAFVATLYFAPFGMLWAFTTPVEQETIASLAGRELLTEEGEALVARLKLDFPEVPESRVRFHVEMACIVGPSVDPTKVNDCNPDAFFEEARAELTAGGFETYCAIKSLHGFPDPEPRGGG